MRRREHPSLQHSPHPSPPPKKTVAHRSEMATPPLLVRTLPTPVATAEACRPDSRGRSERRAYRTRNTAPSRSDVSRA